MFIPTTREELKKLNWTELDVILVTGDAYIDSPYIGVSLIGKILISAGYRTGIIAQPDIDSDKDISRLGQPRLFWGVTGGCIDSMVSNYTALKKKRRSDDFTPGGINDKRPDRATIAYTNLIKKYYKSSAPIVLGGIEASLRRTAHYDFWSDTVRRSVLFDSKADYLLYGMAEKSIIKFADCLAKNESVKELRGLCYIDKEKPEGYTELPSFESVKENKQSFAEMFSIFYKNNDPLNAEGLVQKHNDRYLIQNPPEYYTTGPELDKIFAMDFERDVHPFHSKSGIIKALDTIRFSVTSHFGCYGECNFCAITVHQGRTIRWRSIESIVNEVKKIVKLKNFKGYILDIGGPTANMYGYECRKKLTSGACKDKRCLYPSVCNQLNPDHSQLLELYERLNKIEGIKKTFVASGLRYDLIFSDKRSGEKYFEKLYKNHTSGQLKIAPEHTNDKILSLMGKPILKDLIKFKDLFNRFEKQYRKNQFLTYYFIAAHPGCNEDDMKNMHTFVDENLKLTPEQVQIFTPTPSTFSTMMYYTEINPYTGKRLFVEKTHKGKESQKFIMTEPKRRKF